MFTADTTGKLLGLCPATTQISLSLSLSFRDWEKMFCVSTFSTFVSSVSQILLHFGQYVTVYFSCFCLFFVIKIKCSRLGSYYQTLLMKIRSIIFCLLIKIYVYSKCVSKIVCVLCVRTYFLSHCFGGLTGLTDAFIEI